MIEIAQGKRPMPTTLARRHHYVPCLLLAQWARPPNRNGLLYELTLDAGVVTETKPDGVAWERDLYAIGDPASPDLVIEALLATVEGYAVDPLRGLATCPASLTSEDRYVVALFLALQQGRTPVGLAQHKIVARMAAEQALRASLRDKEGVTKRYREKVNPLATESEIREFAVEQLRALHRGDLKIDLPDEAPHQAMWASVSRVAFDVAASDWTLLKRPGEYVEFIASDRGLSMWDPNLGPSQGNGWATSPTAETMIPISPSVCLRVMPGTAGYSVETASDASVAEINLRTYGWAETAIVGSAKSSLVEVYETAKAQPGLVPIPQVPRG